MLYWGEESPPKKRQLLAIFDDDLEKFLSEIASAVRKRALHENEAPKITYRKNAKSLHVMDNDALHPSFGKVDENTINLTLQYEQIKDNKDISKRQLYKK